MATRSKHVDSTRPAVVGVQASVCQNCGSTDREPYNGLKTRKLAGERNGRKFNRVTWRRTRCRNCGRQRIDKSFELVRDDPPAPIAAELPAVAPADDSPSQQNPPPVAPGPPAEPASLQAVAEPKQPQRRKRVAYWTTQAQRPEAAPSY